MKERPGGGSDLPKPRKRNQGTYGTLPPLKPVGEERTEKPASSGGHQSVRNTRRSYASDTAEFTVPTEYEAYPDDFDDVYDAPPPRPRRQPPKQPNTASRKRRPAARSAAPSGRKYRRRRSSLLGRLLRWAMCLALAVFVLYSAASLALISKLEKKPAGARTYVSGSLDKSYVRSVLLIGTDARDLTQERGRSDSMILLTLNSKTQEISMNSFMRDAYVEIPGHGNNKLNAAYSLGGAELLMDTLELNFDVSIDDYLCVSFTGFAGVIDAFGGVEITLSEEEAQAVNIILQSEVNALMGDDPMEDFLPGGGTYVLDGKQALSYARIRYVGNADFERTSRQREVMTQLISNAKSRAASAAPELMKSALPNISTNMSTAELYLLSLRVPLLAGYSLQQQQIPADGTWSGATVDGQSVLQVDFPANQKLLRETAYAESRSAEEAQ